MSQAGKTQPVVVVHGRKPARCAKRSKARAASRIPSEWAQAIEDIVASAVAARHVGGRPWKARAREVRAAMVRWVPKARFILDARGHPPSKTACRCRCYALLEVDAIECAASKRLPADAVFAAACRYFDEYVAGLN